MSNFYQSNEKYAEKKQKEEDQYYRDLIEQTDQIEKMEINFSDCTEEELFSQILRDEREGTLEDYPENKR